MATPLFGQDLKYRQSNYSVLFWNVENFFDYRPYADGKNSDYTYSGAMRWTKSKFVKKRDQIAATILNLEPDSPYLPILIGVAEIENRFVLNQLIYETPLKEYGYRVVHRDSPDRRGIDVGLLYRRELFKVLKESYLAVDFSTLGVKGYSRDILYVKGVIEALDTLHLFVNHWPSKWGGEKFSAPRREIAASVLATICDSLLSNGTAANILVMGDFNDYCHSPLFKPLDSLHFLKCHGWQGTIKYEGVWEQIDHFMVSSNLLDSLQPISVVADSSIIYSTQELLERDSKFTGERPFRTYLGPRYHGGVSDHLPIMMKIRRNW
ncbi:MAG: endonuclease/exonuclease/phosphatase family protein [Bacteroidales bacterium]